MFSYIYLAYLAEETPRRKASDTVYIMAKIFHICIMIQTAWKARLTLKLTLEIGRPVDSRCE